jgi:hypothetical protein
VPNAAGVGGTAFPQTIFATSNANSVTFSTGIDFFTTNQGVTTGNVAQLTFRTLVAGCDLDTVVRLAPTGFANRISSEATASSSSLPIPFSTVHLVNVSSLAAISAPSVTAANNCGSLPVSVSVSFPASSGLPNASAWPSSFPVGISTVTWSSVDARGVPSTVSRTIEVRDHQILALDVDLAGGITAGSSFTRPIRVRMSNGFVTAATVSFNGANGGAIEVQVPVRNDYSCVSVKDASHTLASAQSLSVSGGRYVTAAAFALRAGDSNDDNNVDVLDFGNFVADRGINKDAASRSNYDRNGVVNNSDFTFIALSFLVSGDACGGGLTGNAPLERVSVKDLRRAGLGHMVEADINGDGWVDATDMALAMQGIYRRDGAPAPQAEDGVESPNW